MVAVRRLLSEVAAEGSGKHRKRAREILTTIPKALREIQARI